MFCLLATIIRLFILGINQIDEQTFCFTISLFHAWNELIVKQNFCVSSWLITKINSLMIVAKGQNMKLLI